MTDDAAPPEPSKPAPPAAAPSRWPALLFVLGLAGVAVATVWLLSLDGAASRRGDPQTDDAYAGGDVTGISARVSGYLVSLPVGDNQPVRAGALIGVVEDDDYRAELAQALARLDAARAQLAALGDQQAELTAQIGQTRSTAAGSAAAITRTGPELARQRRIAGTDAGTSRALDQAVADQRSMQANAAAAQAQVQVGLREVDTLAAQQHEAQAMVAARQADVTLAQLNLGWTRIRAPIDGTLGTRQVRPGDLMVPGTRLVTVTPLDAVWVDANFTERQLTRIRLGQAARLRFDAFPDAVLDGQVVGIQPVTGGRLSAVVPDNTTGNFTKVPARIPVRIALLWHGSGLRGRIRPGMSATAAVLTGTGQ